MLFTLEVLKAHEGDCLLLHWGSNAAAHLAVIDGGSGNIYETSLRPRLDQIRTKRNLAQLVIDLVMVSHIDADHITGVKKLFAKLKAEVEDQEPAKPLRAERLWYNAFDDVIGNAINAHFTEFTASFEASVSGQPKPEAVKTIAAALVARHGSKKSAAAHLAQDISLVLAGHADGRQLRDSQKFLFDNGLTQRLNKPFGKTLITAELTPVPIDFLGLKVTIAGPLQDEIEALQADFDKYLKDHDLQTGQAALAAYADTSIPNLSSIVCLVEAKIGSVTKSVLLTGDARGDRVIEGLRKAGLLGTGAGATRHVSVLKAPHHGSDRNTAPDFFKTLSADIYVFSGDGKYGNPERETINWLIASRSKTDHYTLVFTYKLDDIDQRRKSEAKHWDDAKDSLKMLLDQRRAEGHQFTIREDAPVVIDLGSEVLTA